MNNTIPVWNPSRSKLYQICNGDKNLQIKFEVFSYDEDSGRDALYGGFITTVNEIASGKKEFSLDKSGKRGGTFNIEQFSIVEMPSFMEYLRSGWAINMSLAIDFTASNGELSEPRSLHKQDPTG